MTSPKQTGQTREAGIMGRVFDVAFGCFLGLALLKFGNPAMFDQLVPWPKDGLEWVINSWPLTIAYRLLPLVVVTVLFRTRLRPRVPKWLLAMPLIWLGWQWVAGLHTVDRELTSATLRYFLTAVACFYLGVAGPSGNRASWRFWLPMLVAMALVIAAGLNQHFGGLEQTHRYFFTYVYPKLQSVPPELLKKMSSTRIFSTLFYPNALAGVFLLLLPPLSVMLWRIGDRMTPAARGFLIGLLWAGGMACLYWSGSKGGWLLQLVLIVVTLLHLSVPKKLKVAAIVMLILVGLAGFALKYAAFFQKGATSVVARFDYWRAAVQTTAANPVFGTGPGTFGTVYAKIKSPESEMSKLVHNDYLEQGSDSGLPGFLAYLAFVAGVLWYGHIRPESEEDWLRFAVWLGVLGWALQGVSEFGLYIPALGWTAFGLMGWLVGSPRKRVDKNAPACLPKSP